MMCYLQALTLVLIANGEYAPCFIENIRPTPTTEDEMFDFLKGTMNLGCGERAKLMLEKYNITPKGE